jgi:hypothetical protein
LLVSLIFFPPRCEADIQLKAEVSPQSGTTDDNFTFTVTAEGTQNIPTPLLTGGEGFSLQLLGPQTSLTIINGDVRARIAYIYRLIPKREGVLSTPVAEVEVNSIRYTTTPISVEVRKGEIGADPALGSGQGSLFLRQTVSPTAVYEGQQVVNAVTIYTRVEIREIQLDDLATDGFWQEKISDDQRSTKNIEGVNYAAIEIRKALYPLRSGRIDLPVRSLIARIPERQRPSGFPGFDSFDDRFFDSFFGGALRDVNVSSNSATVEVRPLPPLPDEMRAIAPSVPIVGETSIKANYSVEVINVGESKSITIEVISEGNLNPLKSIPFAAPPGVKIYEEKSDIKNDPRGPRLVTHRYFKYSLVPLKPGLLRVPGVQLPYFDPASGSFKIATSPDVAFVVQGTAAPDQPSTQQDANSTPDATQGATPQTPLKPNPAAPVLAYEEPTLIQEVSSHLSLQLSILLLAAVIGVGVIVFVALRLHRPEAKASVTTAQIDGATSIAELSHLLQKILIAHFHHQAEVATVDQLRSLVTKRVTDRDVALALRSLLDDFELLLYSAPSTVQSSPTAESDPLPGLKARMREVLTRWKGD